MLVARTLQGVGAAGPRLVALAITRDLFSGRQMAWVVSFLMIVFSLVPVVAPTVGAAISSAFRWRPVYLTFVVFSLISIFWPILRQPETLLPEARRPFRAKEIWRGIKDIFANCQVVLAIGAQTLIYAMLFTALMSSQQICERSFDQDANFPPWFGPCVPPTPPLQAC